MEEVKSESVVVVTTTAAPPTPKVVVDAAKPPSIVVQSEKKTPSEMVDLTKYDYVPDEKRDTPVPVNSLRFSSTSSSPVRRSPVVTSLPDSPLTSATTSATQQTKTAPVLHKQPNLAHFDPATAFAAFAQQGRMVGTDAKPQAAVDHAARPKPPKLVSQQPKLSSVESKEKQSVVQRGSIMSGTPIRRMTSSPLQRPNNNQPTSLYPPGLDRALKEGLIHSC